MKLKRRSLLLLFPVDKMAVHTLKDTVNAIDKKIGTMGPIDILFDRLLLILRAAPSIVACLIGIIFFEVAFSKFFPITYIP